MKELSITFCLIFIGFLLGIALATDANNALIERNDVNGYHCTPITTHTSLESAQEQVRVYQTEVIK